MIVMNKLSLSHSHALSLSLSLSLSLQASISAFLFFSLFLFAAWPSLPLCLGYLYKCTYLPFFLFCAA
jgi:hypothetical protein